MSEIVNRVANSPIISLDLENFYQEGDRVSFDLTDYLFQGMVLKEGDFRKSLKEVKWEEYKDKFVAVFCSADAIVPYWAFMLVVTYLQPHAKRAVVGNMEDLELLLFQQSLAELDLESFRDKPVVVKGCSKRRVPLYVYGEITDKLMGYAKSIMYGEPCSTVPLYKKPKQ